MRIFRKRRIQKEPCGKENKTGAQDAELTAKMPRRKIHSTAPNLWNYRQSGIHSINVRFFCGECKGYLGEVP